MYALAIIENLWSTKAQTNADLMWIRFDDGFRISVGTLYKIHAGNINKFETKISYIFFSKVFGCVLVGLYTYRLDCTPFIWIIFNRMSEKYFFFLLLNDLVILSINQFPLFFFSIVLVITAPEKFKPNVWAHNQSNVIELQQKKFWIK